MKAHSACTQNGQEQDWVTACIALGSNLGDRLHYLQGAVDALHAHRAVRCLKTSSVYRSAPMVLMGTAADRQAEVPADTSTDVLLQQNTAQQMNPFFNAVLKLETRLQPLELLELLQSIEQKAGRTRLYPDAPRTLDMDILLYDDRQINEPPRLTVPHPRMWSRAFVLYPLQELAPNLVKKELLQSVCSQDCELMENVVLEV